MRRFVAAIWMGVMSLVSTALALPLEERKDFIDNFTPNCEQSWPAGPLAAKFNFTGSQTRQLCACMADRFAKQLVAADVEYLTQYRQMSPSIAELQTAITTVCVIEVTSNK